MAILFQDNFNYVAGRDEPDIVSIFQSHGWAGAKTQQAIPTTGNPRGYMYTTDTIPGYTGSFPGGGSHVLAMEALVSTLGDRSTGFFGDMQSTINIRYGNAPDSIPADAWFQFWAYPTGGYDRGMKFIYPCNGDYPCHDNHWLFVTGTANKGPETIENGSPAPDQFLTLVSVGGNRSTNSPSNAWKLSQQNTTEQLIGNRWTLVKLHIDTSTTQGSYEAWLKPIGGQWVKVTEDIGGQNGFDWPIPNPGGHQQFVMPGVVGGPDALDPTLNFDSITYIDDFTIADSESSLPNYGATNMTVPVINPLAKGLDSATDIAIQIKQYAQGFNTQSLAGPVRGMEILNLSHYLAVQKDRLTTILGITGLDAFARDQFVDITLNYTTEVNALIAQIDVVVAWVVTNAPNSGGYVHVMGVGANGKRIPNMIGTAPLAGLRTELTNLLATIA